MCIKPWGRECNFQSPEFNSNHEKLVRFDRIELTDLLSKNNNKVANNSEKNILAYIIYTGLFIIRKQINKKNKKRNK